MICTVGKSRMYTSEAVALYCCTIHSSVTSCDRDARPLMSTPHRSSILSFFCPILQNSVGTVECAFSESLTRERKIKIKYAQASARWPVDRACHAQNSKRETLIARAGSTASTCAGALCHAGSAASTDVQFARTPEPSLFCGGICLPPAFYFSRWRERHYIIAPLC